MPKQQHDLSTPVSSPGRTHTRRRGALTAAAVLVLALPLGAGATVAQAHTDRSDHTGQTGHPAGSVLAAPSGSAFLDGFGQEQWTTASVLRACGSAP